MEEREQTKEGRSFFRVATRSLFHNDIRDAMQFTVSSDQLHDALKTAKRGSARSATMPILEDVLIREKEDRVTLRGTDLEAHVKTSLPVQMEPTMGLDESVAEATEATLPVDRLTSTLKELPDMPVEVTIDTEGKVTLETDQGSYEMQGHQAEDFPDLPEMDPEEEMDAAPLEGALEKVAFCMSEDALRPAMEGVFLDAEGNAVVATDGHRLSRVQMEVPLNESVIISRAGVSLMQRVIGEGTTLAIGEDRAWVVLRGERTSVYSRLIDETYPNYESVIPDNNDKTLRVNREEMVGATKRTGIYSSSMTNQIRLTLHPDRLTLDAEDVERSSEAEEKVFCEFNGEEEMEIGFNAEYLETVLSKTVAEEVKMKLSSPNRAGLVRPVGDEDHLMLLMPVMINGHG